MTWGGDRLPGNHFIVRVIFLIYLSSGLRIVLEYSVRQELTDMARNSFLPQTLFLMQKRQLVASLKFGFQVVDCSIGQEFTLKIQINNMHL